MSHTMKLHSACQLLQWVSYGMLVFVAIWWLAAPPFLDGPASLLLDTLVWPVDGGHELLSQDARFLSAIGSGLMASLASLFLLVVIPELKRGNFRILRGTVISILVWYIIDSAGSAWSGVSSNVFFNSLFLIALLAPLWLISNNRENQSQ